jgi:hypothetical protein
MESLQIRALLLNVADHNVKCRKPSMLLNVDGQKVTLQSVTFSKHKRYIAPYVPERKLSLNLKKFKT